MTCGGGNAQDDDGGRRIGAAIAVPDSDQTFQFNLHQFEVGARGRYFFGDGPDAPALLVGLGLWENRPAQVASKPIGAAQQKELAWPAG